MDGEEIIRRIFGDKQIDDQNKLKELLDSIEEKYCDWFLDRPHPFRKDSKDSIHMHVILKVDGDMRVFQKDPMSDLPDYIYKECIDAFYTIYPKQ